MLALLRDGRPRTRAELAALTGLARSTVAQRIDALIAGGLISEVGGGVSTGGRPPVRFAFNPLARVALAADIGATHALLAVTDLSGTVLAETRRDLDIALGPEAVLGWVADSSAKLLGEVGRRPRDVLGIGVGLPGPVEYATGRPVSPPIMPGWDGFEVRDFLYGRLGVPAMADNDVNVMALGEYFARWSDVDNLVFVKVATGIGCGLISNGRLHRGAQGAAGDFGHIRVSGAAETVCRCGNTGCLEAVAGGAAVAARLRALGVEAASSRDVVRLATGGSREAVDLLRQAGREIGQGLAAAVSLLNPSVVVVGGTLAGAGEHLIAGVREIVYQRSLPLATQHLQIAHARTGERAGVIGAAVMVLEHALSAERVDDLINS
ncbi:ROK family transcriptional regulator [Streptomyces phytophilus]|uniref:ROK family transcriptional regulator n=1 Tax=Streptomyces phytophilus TaxID=722715 RepID=UPI0035A99DE8